MAGTMMAKAAKHEHPSVFTRTTIDTIVLTREEATAWLIPSDVQRELTVNQNVKDVAEELKRNGGVMPGVIHLGIVDGKKYLLDGQQRRGAFLLSGLNECYTDIRTQYFDSMADFGSEFVKLNSHLVRMTSDDVLRALSITSPALQLIRKECNFVGYDRIRRATPESPILSMSTVIRAFYISASDSAVPRGPNVLQLATNMTIEEARLLIGFLEICDEAWGRDAAYARLWAMLNLALSLWLYRRTVIKRYSAKTPEISPSVFRSGMELLAANKSYIQWLGGKALRDEHRSPAYARIKMMLARAYEARTGRTAYLPQPAWAS